MQKLLTILAAIAIAVPVANARDEADLLPVDQAFKLSANVAGAGHIALHWDIAPHYYLYRSRIKAKTDTTGATLGELDLPAGEKEHDAFLGDVEIYHDRIDASVPYTLNDDGVASLALAVTMQGCHEVDPKICYPPHSVKLNLDIAAATRTTTPLRTDDLAASPFAKRLGGSSGALEKRAGDNLPLPPGQAFTFEAIAASPTAILARWTMPPGYYLYRDKSRVTLKSGDGIALGPPDWPAGVQHTDEHFGTVTVYFNEVELPITLKRVDSAPQSVSVTAAFQGCQENGICYPVMTRDVSIDLPAASAAQIAAANAAFTSEPSPSKRESGASHPRATTAPAGSDTTTRASATQASDQSEDQLLAAQLSDNRLLALVSFFGFGLLLAFTPCVFPMIPILSGIIAGAGENVSTARAFVLSVVYVLATAVVFTIAGVVAGLAGANLQAAFQQPWILWCFALLFVLLALSMFGFYELQLPASWQTRLANASNRQRPGSLPGVAIMGVLSALIVGPCVAPPLAAAVLYISQTRDPVFGGLALFVLALGMGAPLIAFGTAAGRLLPRTGAWMEAVKSVFGVVFLALAIWMLSRILDPLWIMLLSGALLIASAVYLGALERLPEGASGWRRLWKALGLILLIAGAAELVGSLAGSRDITEPLAGLSVGAGGAATERIELPFRTINSTTDLDRELATAGQPVMLDFYADWCVSCKEMERFTFSRPAVRQALSGFVLLKADVTANDAADQALLKRFGLFGPPATLFFGKHAHEQRGLRLIGFEDADRFLARLGKVRR
ncbi:MAG: protein-disulfide reductase DsbD [Rhodanobacteraceae bacterium]